MKNYSLCLYLILLALPCTVTQAQQVTLQFKHKRTNGEHPEHFVINRQSTIDSLTIKLKQHADSLRKKGYLFLKLNPLQKIDNVLWLQKIDLGQKIDSVTVSYLYENTDIEKSLPVALSRKRDTTIAVSEMNLIIQKIETEHNELGIYFNTYQYNNFKTDDSNIATADLKISSSRSRVIDNIIIKGYKKYPKKFITPLLKKKLILNNSNIKKIETQATSQDLGVISKPSEVLYKKDSTKLYLYIEKRKNNRAEGMLGLNNANNENKTEVNGYIDLELNNNLNSAEKFKLLYRNDGNDLTTLDIKASIPLLIYNKIGIKTSLNITRRDSLYSNVTFNAGLFYNLGTASTLGINYINYESTDIREQFNTENISTNGVNTEYTYNATNESNNLMFENTQITTTIGLQRRKIDELISNQWVSNATISKLWHLNHRIKFFNLIQGGVISSRDIRLNEAYQIGGINSIRGFAQNSVDTSRYVTLLNELRWVLSDQLYLYSITDIGVFENFQTRKSESLYGLGAGIAILTQSGIVTFSLANGSFKNANLNLSSLIAHVNLRIRF